MHVIYCITTKPCYITITSHFTITLFALQLNIAPSHINVTTVRCYIKVSRIKFSQNPVCTWQNLQTSVVNMVIGLALQQAQVMYYSFLLIHFITYLTSFIFQQIRNNPNTRKNKKTKNKIEKLICLTTRSSEPDLYLCSLFFTWNSKKWKRKWIIASTRKKSQVLYHTHYMTLYQWHGPIISHWTEYNEELFSQHKPYALPFHLHSIHCIQI